jgi:tripartite-type tricarboxylate transporter receptor subunit TctC
MINQMDRLVALAAFMLCVTSAGLGQSYLNKPVHLLAGFAPGSGVDFSARIIASKK